MCISVNAHIIHIGFSGFAEGHFGNITLREGAGKQNPGLREGGVEQTTAKNPPRTIFGKSDFSSFGLGGWLRRLELFRSQSLAPAFGTGSA